MVHLVVSEQEKNFSNNLIIYNNNYSHICTHNRKNFKDTRIHTYDAKLLSSCVHL